MSDEPSLRESPALAPVPRALVDLQTLQRCRVCGHTKRYCQQVGHAFVPVVTCESCIHMGRRYWGSDDFPDHFCDRSNERRAAAFKSTGDRAEDFMQEFRRFYDAGPKKTNCGRFFEPKATPQAPESNRKDGSSQKKAQPDVD